MHRSANEDKQDEYDRCKLNLQQYTDKCTHMSCQSSAMSPRTFQYDGREPNLINDYRLKIKITNLYHFSRR